MSEISVRHHFPHKLVLRCEHKSYILKSINTCRIFDQKISTSKMDSLWVILLVVIEVNFLSEVTLSFRNIHQIQIMLCSILLKRHSLICYLIYCSQMVISLTIQALLPLPALLWVKYPKTLQKSFIMNSQLSFMQKQSNIYYFRFQFRKKEVVEEKSLHR